MATEADVLFKKGKRFAAAYLQQECITSAHPTLMNELLDILLDPEKTIDSWDTIDWCRWLMAGGKTPDEYAQTVRRYDNATTCGLVWTANFVAFRCRTCGISPCMSLCAECFLQGNHEDHDYNMFRSQAGGACDCGDTSVMKESGFCLKHGPKSQSSKLQIPPDLLCIAEALMPRLILRLIQHLRQNSLQSREYTAIQEADGFLTMLHQLSELGGAMRKVMTHVLSNPHVYHTHAIECFNSNPDKAGIIKENYQFYLNAKERLTNYEFPEEYHYIKALRPELKHETFLEELMFWTVRYEFPQKLVCFLLNMLPDSDYKVAFTQTFVHHYSRITVMLAHSSSADALSNRVVHVSVQLFSNENLTLRITQELQLLHVMVISLKAMMSSISQPHTLQVPEKNLHCVVDCSHSIMKEHCYWPLVCDLNNVLTHQPVTLEFLKDTKLLDMWFSFLLMFQGMNVNKRELRDHVEFEPNTYYAAFLTELEASASPMWALISHLQGPETLHLTKQVIVQCLTSLEDWFDAIGFSSMDVPNPYQVSFHLPLHRYVAIFLYQAVCQQGASLKELMPSQEMLKMMLFHPLQVQVAFQEILNGMWARNGLQIKGQAMTYIQCHFCTSLVDADIFLLQLCAGGLDPDVFLRTVLQRFQVWEWLSFKEPSKLSYLEPEQVMPMLEGALTFLATIMDIHTNMGLSEEEITRREMISLLCMNNRTHSQLVEFLPEKCGTNSQNKDFENILSQIADYTAPNFEAGGNMWQGMYAPKAEIWENEYDPIHTLLRAVHRRDFQASVDRYTQYVRQSSKYQGSGSPWLPYRIPGNIHKEFNDPRRVLQSKTFHSLVLTVLYRALTNSAITEQILALCIYLLDMSVRSDPTASTEYAQDSDPIPRKSKDEVPDMDYQEWFPSSSHTLVNLWQEVNKVVVPQTIEMRPGLVEEMDVNMDFEDPDNDQVMIQALQSAVYQVQSPGGDDSGDEPSPHQLQVQLHHHQQQSHKHRPGPPPGGTGCHPLVPLALLPSAAAFSPSYSTSTSPSSSSSNNSNNALVPLSSSMMISQSAMESTETTVALSTSVDMSPMIASAPMSPLDLPLTLPPYLMPQALEMASTSNNASATEENMAIVPTPIGPARIRPRCLKLRHKQNLSVAGQAPFKALSYLRPTIQIGESIVSLLLQMHSKITGKADSYQPPNPTEAFCEPVRLGDGSVFIQQLLDRVIKTQGTFAHSRIQSMREQLWPQQQTVSQDDQENMKVDGQEGPLDKEERRRRAKERQQKLMAEFASRQRAFMEQSLKTDADMDTGGETGGPDSLLEVAKEYECIICSQTTPSTLEKPIGMVILVQATSVLGHAHEDKAECRRLPCSDEERLHLKNKCCLGAHNEKRLHEMARFFDSSSWQLALNIGWDGGVHVQSCGHYLHIDCQKSYIQSLKSQTHQNQQRQNLAVDRGEYLCPLCRQLANSVLHINSDMGEASALVRCHHSQLSDVAKELAHLFTVSPEGVSVILKQLAEIMEDLTLATYQQYRSYCTPDSHSLYLFVCSIIRTNLEVELLLRRDTLSSSAIKKSCFVPLFHVLARHAKVLARVCFVQCWSQMSGLPLEDHMSSLAPLEQEVPVLLRDVSAILIQMILSLPLHMDKAYYSCVIQVLYNLSCLQAVAQVSCKVNLQQRLRWKEHSKAAQNQLKKLGVVLGTVVDHLEHSSLYLDDEDLDVDLRMHEWTESELERDIQALVLPFLRVASLLQGHLYTQDLPHIKEPGEEYGTLCKFLCLSLPGETSFAAHLEWASSEPLLVVRTWCQDFINFVNRSLIAARTLLERPLKWHPPALLRLPKNYNCIFQYYHRRMCLVCHSVPKDPSMCLVCGTLVCLRENCCRQQSLSEAVMHSVNCGAGTALYLAVNSSTIVVIRGKRACLWGSVYLDKYGEEDRDLKRGKPLYLSEERYQLLEQQWLSHSFDHTNKRWVWHRDNL